jgi:hypothetical protein
VLDGFVPQAHEPGRDAEGDFGDVWLYLAGVLTKCHLFTFRLSCSGKSVHRCYASQGQEAFFEGHVAAFDAFYCQPGREGAHEKGGVEGEVGRFRRRWIVPVPDVGSLAEFNAYLVEADQAENARHVDGRAASIGAAFATEAPLLSPLPNEPFDCALTGTCPPGRSAPASTRPWRLVRIDLLCLDELGHLELDRRGAELLFQGFTEREEKASIAVASNAAFSEWARTFTDPRLCAAIVDRLTFDAHIIETGTKSYRLKTTRKRREKTTATA